MDTLISEEQLARRWYFSLITAYGAILFNVVVPIVRLTVSEANLAALFLAQLLPVGAFIVAFIGWRGLRRVVAVLASVPLLLMAVPGAMILPVGAFMGAGLEDERLQTIATGWSRVTVYRTNGGATTAFGITVRQECPVLPGVLVVHQLAHEYPAHDVAVQFLEPRHVRLSFPVHGVRPTKTIDALLWPLP